MCERNIKKKSCNLIMIIGLICSDDNFSIWWWIWGVRLCMRKMDIDNTKKYNLYNLNIQVECCWWNCCDDCDCWILSYDLLMFSNLKLCHQTSNKGSLERRKVSNRSANKKPSPLKHIKCITRSCKQQLNPFHHWNRSEAVTGYSNKLLILVLFPMNGTCCGDT